MALAPKCKPSNCSFTLKDDCRRTAIGGINSRRIVQESSQVAMFSSRMLSLRQLHRSHVLDIKSKRRVYSTVAGTSRAQETRLIKCNNAETQTSTFYSAWLLIFPCLSSFRPPVVSSNCQLSREDVYPGVCWHSCLEH